MCFYIRKCLDFRDQVAEQATVVKEVEGRGKQLMGIIESNIQEFKNIEQQLDQSVKTAPIN